MAGAKEAEFKKPGTEEQRPNSALGRGRATSARASRRRASPAPRPHPLPGVPTATRPPPRVPQCCPHPHPEVSPGFGTKRAGNGDLARAGLAFLGTTGRRESPSGVAAPGDADAHPRGSRSWGDGLDLRGLLGGCCRPRAERWRGWIRRSHTEPARPAVSEEVRGCPWVSPREGAAPSRGLPLSSGARSRRRSPSALPRRRCGWGQATVATNASGMAWVVGYPLVPLAPGYRLGAGAVPRMSPEGHHPTAGPTARPRRHPSTPSP